MKTILYQGKPPGSDDWLVLPPGFVATYRELGYETRELVLRADAEKEIAEAQQKARKQ